MLYDTIREPIFTNNYTLNLLLYSNIFLIFVKYFLPYNAWDNDRTLWFMSMYSYSIQNFVRISVSSARKIDNRYLYNIFKGIFCAYYTCLRFQLCHLTSVCSFSMGSTDCAKLLIYRRCHIPPFHFVYRTTSVQDEN